MTALFTALRWRSSERISESEAIFAYSPTKLGVAATSTHFKCPFTVRTTSSAALSRASCPGSSCTSKRIFFIPASRDADRAYCSNTDAGMRDDTEDVAAGAAIRTQCRPGRVDMRAQSGDTWPGAIPHGGGVYRRAAEISRSSCGETSALVRAVRFRPWARACPPQRQGEAHRQIWACQACA